MHSPATQVSLSVQASPSSHPVPSVVLMCVHFCVATSQESSVHGLVSLQFRPEVPAQVPAVHTSPVEQGFLSSQVVPSVALV
jgi:hypothetical protein